MLRNIHVIGIDPGGTTGWCRLTVPRDSVFGREESSIIEWDYGEVSGHEPQQVVLLARLARETQSLDYLVGPALVVERWDVDPHFQSRDTSALSPARIGAMLLYAQHRGDLSDARVTFQSRVQAKQALTDERLRALGLYVKGSEHVRDATRHALCALRRARQSSELRKEMWSEELARG
jgi:hypothetical protein